ncbi:MAG TPA: VOC family protein [Chloroflexota bacterium]|nr:VOC family protein [Chloroflexota bacterium]
MLKAEGVYHMGIPVNDIDRAQAFYTKVLGMEFMDRVGTAQKLDRLKCGHDTVVLFERPRPHSWDPVAQDGVAHQAFEMDLGSYEEALKMVKEMGLFRTTEDRESGNTIYLFDTEGNHLELHFSKRKAGSPS